MKKSFRPSARLISTIGEDIIKDMHAAVVELVKNSYDADAHEVEITFSASQNNKLFIIVKDNGHGMKEDIVTDKWMVPSTSDKLTRKTSPDGRIMQGRKGIGRFAAAILGEKLRLETVSDNIKTELKIDWNEFDENKYLDEILIDLTTSQTHNADGTVFSIEGSSEKLEQWNDDEIDYLIKELRKLLTPIDNSSIKGISDRFDITVIFEKYPSDKYNNQTIRIKPLPLIDYYDYRIFGDIYPNGHSVLTYQNKNSGIEEAVSDFEYFLSAKEKISGKISVDFRIFDRDPEAIETLIYELFNASDEKLGKNEAKKMLNDISGVSIFRNRFRIRPYGDVEYDWLSLDKKRVQNPAQKIGANQISGIIEIEDEEVSNLVEKSARDGLKEDTYYDGLVSIVNQLLSFVEIKRYSYRQKTGRGRKNYIFSSQLGILTDYSAVKNKVISVMQEANISSQKVTEINSFIEKDIDDKIKVAQELERQIAMYQGQATLGKIMDVVMHEVTKPLSWMRNQTYNVERAYNRYLKDGNSQDLNKIMRIIEETPNQLRIISALFKRLNSLATRNRTAMADFSLSNTIETALEIFSNEIVRNNITVKWDATSDIHFVGWREDILAAIANILENAVFWVNFNKNEKLIDISINETVEAVEISIWNNGPKIIKDLLNNNSLFDPGISGKVTNKGVGTGLGLAIAGESIDRNGGSIKVIDVSVGAKFIIELPKKEKE